MWLCAHVRTNIEHPTSIGRIWHIGSKEIISNLLVCAPCTCAMPTCQRHLCTMYIGCTHTHTCVGGAAASKQTNRHVVWRCHKYHFSNIFPYMKQVFGCRAQRSLYCILYFLCCIHWKGHLLIPHQVRQLVSTEITESHANVYRREINWKIQHSCLSRWDA